MAPTLLSYLSLLNRIGNQQARVGILGLGYVGLPLARAFCGAGFHVWGFDVDATKIEKLRRGESYIRHISDLEVRSILPRFTPTGDFDELANIDAILITVPTPLTRTREPDLSYVLSATRAVAERLRPGQLVVLESTTYPGTTRDELLPILRQSGLKVGQDFFLAFSPEREDPGNAKFSTTNIPKVVGGIDPSSLELASALYKAITQVVPVSSPEIAEACKILENTYRAVNIAMVNELKIVYDRMGIDIWEVIDAAKTKPFGYQAFYPGPGLGGHCIPIDPFYLTWIARKHGVSTRFIELAGEINTAMPRYVASKVGSALNEVGKPIKGSKIGLLGMAYKKDVDDARESPALEIFELLREQGAVVSYNDPHVPHVRLHEGHGDAPPIGGVPLTAEYLRSQDCVVVVTDHSAYDFDWIMTHARLIVDTRNATRRSQARVQSVRAA